MAARAISDPVHLYDCVMPCAGAEAFIVTTPERAEALGLKAAQMRGAIERHNAPSDMHMLQAYDDYPVIVAMQIEDLGFCEKGAVSRFIGKNEFGMQGSLPLNTNGGQLSAGQAGAAGGFQNVTEALRQILRMPLGAQVPGATRALVSGFGMVNYDRGVCSGAAVLEAL